MTSRKQFGRQWRRLIYLIASRNGPDVDEDDWPEFMCLVALMPHPEERRDWSWYLPYPLQQELLQFCILEDKKRWRRKKKA